MCQKEIDLCISSRWIWSCVKLNVSFTSNFVVIDSRKRTNIATKWILKMLSKMNMYLHTRQINLYNHSGESLTQWVVHIINQVWIHEELPDDWRWGIILPFWKCRKIKWFVASTGVLHFSQYQKKLFTHTLLSRALPVIHSGCQSQQSSFMPNQLTTDYISVLWVITEKTIDFCKDHHFFIALLISKQCLAW